MSRFAVRIEQRTVIPYTVEAENEQDAMERVLAGEGDKGDEDYPEPDIFVKSLEG